ncbi:MAG: SDR family NAD(P)-dependent oxidoreductase [Blastocatellia bacterium]
MKHIVITGASTGIGLAAAQSLTRAGFHVYGSVRKQADADRVSAQLGSAFTPLLFDVTDEAAVHAGAKLVREKLGGQKLAGLVNNAGIATPGPLAYLPVAAFRQQLEVNLVGQLIATQAFLPLLGLPTPGMDQTLTGPPGRIINISSVAGKIAMPFVGPYATSKHGLEAFSASLRRELLPFGIDVIIIGPGSIVTPIWDKAEQLDLAPYENTPYAAVLRRFQKVMLDRGREGLPVEKMGELILHTLTTTSPRTRYAIVPQKLANWIIPRLAPARMVDKMIARMLFTQK